MSTTNAKRGAGARFLALLASLTMMVAGLVGVALAAPASATPANKITICHATSAASNPYVTPTVDMSSVDEANNWDWNGHGDHSGPVFDPATMKQGDSWGDIIPPFSYTFTKKGVTTTVVFPGYNWSTEGQAIYNNGCKPVPPPPVVDERTVYWCDAEGDVQEAKQTSTNGGAWTPAIPGSSTTRPASCGDDEVTYEYRTLYRCAPSGSGAIEEWEQSRPVTKEEEVIEEDVTELTPVESAVSDEVETRAVANPDWSPAPEGDGWGESAPTNCGTELRALYWCDADADRQASTSTRVNGGAWSEWSPSIPEGVETSQDGNLDCSVPEEPPVDNPPPPVVNEEPPAPPVVQEAQVTVAAPEAATVAAPAPATVAVPAAATLPAAIPAGEGSGNGLPMWTLAMIAAGMIGAAVAGKQLLGAST